MNYVKKVLFILLVAAIGLVSSNAHSYSVAPGPKQPIESHDIFYIDSDGDGEFDDLLFEARERKIEVPYSILIRLSSEDPSFILEKQEDGTYLIKVLTKGEEYSGEKLGTEGSLDVSARDITGDGEDSVILNKTTGPSETLVLNLGENGEAPVIGEHYMAGEGITPEQGQSFVKSFPEEASLVGATGGTFSVSSTGASTYAIGLDVAAGANGHQPQLQLVYNSRTGNGVLGRGWSLIGISAIRRCSSTPAHGESAFNGVRLATSDRLCMGGERLILTTDGDYWADGASYRTERDSQQTITRVGERFEIKDNVGGVRIFDQVRPELWAVSTWENKFGQIMQFSYLDDMQTSMGVLPKEITYGAAKVKFDFGQGRNDMPDKYVGGERRSLDHYLRKVQISRRSVRNSLDYQNLREYQLHYNYEEDSGELLLKYAQNCGYNSEGNERKCALPLEILYSETPNAISEKPIPMLENIGSELTARPAIIDWNGDGINDFIANVAGSGLNAYLGSHSDGGGASVETLLSASEHRYFLTPYMSNSGERGIVYLHGEVIQEKFYEDILVTPGYYEIEANATWKSMGTTCQIAVKCSGGYDAIGACDGHKSTVKYFGSVPNPPDQYDRTYTSLRCDNASLKEKSKYEYTYIGTASGFYPEKKGDYIDPVYETVEIIPDYKSFVYSWNKKFVDSSGDIRNKYIASGRICMAKDYDFDVRSEFYRPLVGDFSGSGDLEIYVARPTCDSIDAKEIAWRPAVNSDQSLIDPDFDLLKGIPFSLDGRQKNQIAERKEGGFEVREIESDTVFDLKTDSGVPIPSDWSVLVDVNADGLSDVVSFGLSSVDGTRDKNNIYIFINQDGSFKDPLALDYSTVPGFGSGLAQILDLSRSYESPVSDRIRILDYDKNGLADLLILNGSSPENEQYANSLFVLRTVTSDEKEPVFEFVDVGIKNENLTDLDRKVVIYDADGDTRSDIFIAHNDGYRRYGPQGDPGSVVKSFVTRFPSGEERITNVDYSRLNDPEVYDHDEVRELDYQTFASPLSVVKSAHLPTKESTWDSIEYRYSNAKMNMKGRGFLGFESYTAESSTRNRKTTFEFYGAGTSEEGDFFPKFPYIGKLVRKTVENTASGNSLSVTANVWASQSLPENEKVKRPYLGQTVRQSYDSEGSSIGAKRVSTTLDDYGNLDQTVSEVGASVDDPHLCLELGSCELSSIQWRTTKNYVYTPALPTFLESLDVTSEKDIAISDASSATTYYSFEPHDDFPNVVGEKVTSWDTDGQSESIETLNYSSNSRREGGLLRSVSLSSGASVPELNRIKERTTAYSDYQFGVFPGEITYPEQQKDILDVDIRSGQPTQIRDVNGLVTNYQYDPLGRTVRRAFPEGYISTTRYEFCSAGSCPDFATNAVLRVVETGNDNSERVLYLDAYNRKVAATEKQFDGGINITTFAYDNQGRIREISEPHSQGDVKDVTSYQYSETKDLVTLTRPDLSTRSIHTTGRFGSSVFVETVDTVTRDSSSGSGEVGGRSTIRNELLDLNGNVRYVQEWINDTEKDAEIVLDYDARERMSFARVIKATGEASTVGISYNDQAQTKTLEDPDTGVTITKYNTVGEIVEEVHKGLDTASGQDKIFSFEYDRLGRQVQVSEATKGILGQWFYDEDSEGRSCGLGRLCEKSGPMFEENYFYKGWSGLVGSIETKLRSGPDSEPRTYNFTYDYDHTGREKTVRYPSGFSIERGYKNGYLASLTDLSPGSEAKELWRADAYDERGQIDTSIFGNGLTISRNYDEVGRLRGLTAGVGESATDLLQSKAYGYDSLGNLTHREDKLGNVNESFDYDGLNRLHSREVVSASGTADANYEYDLYGNVTNKPGVGSYEYSSYTSEGACDGNEEYANPGPHAVREAGGNVYCYDEFGNQIRGAGRSIEYGVIGKPVEISQGSDSVQFLYGPDESRFYQKKQAGGEVTETFYVAGGMFEEEIADGKSTFKSYLDGFIVDKRSESSASQIYLLRDNLGSVDTVVDDDVSDGLEGSIIETMAYAPFGERLLDERVNSTERPDSDDRGFTGHEHFDEFGLIHMNGRVYDPVIGRFLSADPYVQDPYSSQSYNRYSYVWNNPLSGTDPSGYNADFANGNSGGGITIRVTKEIPAPPLGQNWESGRNYNLEDIQSNIDRSAGINIPIDPGGSSANYRSEDGNIYVGPDYGRIDDRALEWAANHATQKSVAELTREINSARAILGISVETNMGGVSYDAIRRYRESVTDAISSFACEQGGGICGAQPVYPVETVALGGVGSVGVKGALRSRSALAPGNVSRSLDDLSSLRGARPSDIERMADARFLTLEWTKKPLKRGKGVRYFDEKGNSFQLNYGYPGGTEMHGGPYIKTTQGSQSVRIPLEGNPDL